MARWPWRLPSRHRWQLAMLIVSVVATLVGLAGLLARGLTPGPGWRIGLAAFSPYLMLGAPLGVLGFSVVRWWGGTAVAVVATVLAVLTQAPLYAATTAPAGAPRLVVMTANLKLGAASAVDVVSTVRRHHVDVLMLEELTAEEQQRLVAAGLDSVLPHVVSAAANGAAGTGLWSRYPLTDSTVRHDFVFGFVSARATIPGTSVRPLLVALHMPGPWPQSPGPWRTDIARAAEVLRGLPGSVLVGGDFNATRDVKQFRTVLAAGYHDAAEQAGAGVTRTFPADTWYPPLIAIDHVLTRAAVASSVHTVRIPGSDHRALVVSVALASTG